jgi:lipopolysaccharide/colanic/teichoic acid biosynthesis glycosyltransferase
MKRLFDLSVSIVGIIVLLPICLVIILLILLSDYGPVFYRQERIGLHGRKFLLWKFRTMKVKGNTGHEITLGTRDPRITKVGYILRMLKLDEIPQLLNVIKGDMSIVGPRPEVEKYVRLYSERQRKVLNIRPGCIDITMIKGHIHDASLLNGQEDPEDYYVKKVMPDKLDYNLAYLDNQSLLLDIKIIVVACLKLMRILK